MDLQIASLIVGWEQNRILVLGCLDGSHDEMESDSKRV